VTKPLKQQSQPPDATTGQATYTGSVHRKVSVKGSSGVDATVIVIARQGNVWLSITPAFTWEAIMEPRKVDELMHTLGLAREDATRMTTARIASHRDGTGVREITSGTVTLASKDKRTKKVQS